MKIKAACIVLVLFFLAGQGLAGDDAPVVISPGGGPGVAAVEGGCPTFSWSGVPWARKYRVAVFAVESGARAPVGERKLATPPALSQETAAGGSSWTPGADQALEVGKEYAWCVGAMDANGAWTWSEMGRFRVDGSARRRLAEERPAEAEKGALEGGDLPQNGEAAAGDANGRKSPVEKARSVQGTEGIYSTFYGYSAGASNSNDTNQNSFFGSHAGTNVTSGTMNTYIGAGTGTATVESSTGSENTFVGSCAGNAITTGHQNTFVGRLAGNVNTTGYYNNFIGCEAGSSNTTGIHNTFLGYYAGHANTSGQHNTFLGNGSGEANTIGAENIFVGGGAGQGTTTGNNNTYIGYAAGHYNPLGSGNVFLGYKAGWYEERDNRLVIDNSDTQFPLIFGEFDRNTVSVFGQLGVGCVPGFNDLEIFRNGSNCILTITRADGAMFKLSAMGASGQLGTISSHPINFMTNNVKRLTVAVNGNVGIGVTQPAYPLHMASGAHCTTGGVWTNASSVALKQDIAPLDAAEAEAALRGLRPVTYTYKADASEKYVGFIAEEVPELVAQNDRKGLSSMDIVAVLAKVVQEQQKEIALLKEEMAKLKRRSRLD